MKKDIWRYDDGFILIHTPPIEQPEDTSDNEGNV